MWITDQLGENFELNSVPKRIVSLVPSQTELLVHLGLIDKIVGITKFCVHPSELRKHKTIVGGTKDVHYHKIDKLNPDIILCNKEENTKEIVERLGAKYPVHVSDIFTIEDAIEMIGQYGEIFNVRNTAKTLIVEIKSKLTSFQSVVDTIPKKRVAYFMWRKPWMVVAGSTFINHLIEINGFENVFKNRSRYPEISEEEILHMDNVDMVLLSSEPFPFSEKHIIEIKKLLPNSVEVKLVDGEYFSWYGSRLADAFGYFRSLH
ncbi:helical backbone metal receptor [Aquimarina sp. MMG016]|uniref:helical backbone metal receptor n=1 Tax=Aquimarina sp. MMG016 TaxID=2822690 RepID=UPI001B39F1C2|nr:helical backbone metal receptor [Aquimarina sp. MMG016]MBQ4820401.1 ABC transporter substrate-binding protein [Aquimarina sp. MMG016]